MCSQTFKPIRENYAYATNDTAIFKLAKQMDKHKYGWKKKNHPSKAESICTSSSNIIIRWR